MEDSLREYMERYIGDDNYVYIPSINDIIPVCRILGKSNEIYVDAIDKQHCQFYISCVEVVDIVDINDVYNRPKVFSFNFKDKKVGDIIEGNIPVTRSFENIHNISKYREPLRININLYDNGRFSVFSTKSAIYAINGSYTRKGQCKFPDGEHIIKQWYSDGRLKFSFGVLDGNLHGPFETYNEDGSPSYYIDKFHGHNYGSVKVWKNGKQTINGEILNNKLTGFVSYLNERSGYRYGYMVKNNIITKTISVHYEKPN